MKKKSWISPFDRFRTSWFFILFLIVVQLFLIFQLILIFTEKNPPNLLQPYVLKDEINTNNTINNLTNQSSSAESENISDYTLKSAPISSGAGGGGAGGGGASSTTEEEPNTLDEPFPDDLSSKPCGYYYRQTGLCTGSCPVGICSSEGESCYCKT